MKEKLSLLCLMNYSIKTIEQLLVQYLNIHFIALNTQKFTKHSFSITFSRQQKKKIIIFIFLFFVKFIPWSTFTHFIK